MSFGFGVGDFLAVIHSLKRISEEVQGYRDAPQHFQQLNAELRLLESTLQCVLQIQTTDVNELAGLERIRLIVMHCQQPLQAFINKIRSKESSLGHFRSAGTISAVGERLHWSLIRRKDVEDLRKVIVSEMVAINILLGLQQLTYLRTLEKDELVFRSDARQHFAASKALLTNTIDILSSVETLPHEIRHLRGSFASHASKNNKFQGKITEGVSTITVNTELIISQGKKALESAHSIGNQAAKIMATISSLMANVHRLMKLLGEFSKEVLGQIAKNTQMLLDIHAKIKQILRAIDAIPLHLTLDIVRFDDALGESWALPFQACREWETFKDILQTVVFRNNRIGSNRVALGQFMIISARDNSVFQSYTWKSNIKPGAHISQSMVVSKQTIGDRCQFPSCNEPLTDLRKSERGYSWEISKKCGRWSVIYGRTTNLLQLAASGDTNYPLLIGEDQTPRAPNIKGPSLPPVQTLQEDFSSFRRIHVYHTMSPIATLEEAHALLDEDPESARALQFIAWFNYPHRDNIAEEPRKVDRLRSTIDLLERSIRSDPLDSQTWYLLGRAFMDIGQVEKAYENYQQAIYREGAFPGYWHSVGVLYYVINQFLDSFDAFTRSVRLNPYIPEAWYCLGVLYESAENQPNDAAEGYERYLKLSQTLDATTTARHKHLLQVAASEANSSKVPPLPMRDVDLRGKSHQQQSAEHYENIRIPGLAIRDAVDSEGDWSDTDLDEDDN